MFVIRRLLTLRRCVKITVCSQHTARAQTDKSHKQEFMPIFMHANQYGDKIALKDRFGDYTYRGVFLSSRQLSSEISKVLDGKREERVAVLCPSDASYLISSWACWMSGQVVIPLCPIHPVPVMEHYVNNSEASLIITTKEYAQTVEKISKKCNSRLLVLDDSFRLLAMQTNVKIFFQTDEDRINYDTSFYDTSKPQFYHSSKALIVYTSGTTGTPRGAVISHGNIHAQVTSLVESWNWNSNDAILHTLPLHHTQGIMMLLSPLAVGAKCVLIPQFDASEVWTQLLALNTPVKSRINIFVGTPNMYTKLIEEYDRAFARNTRMEEYVKSICSQKIRLMASGSAALTDTVFHKWKSITGHQIMQHYGMAETGIVMSNTHKNLQHSGCVGTPLPTVDVQIVHWADDGKYEVLVTGNSRESVINSSNYGSGELLLKSPGIFEEYWKKSRLTRESFKDGWFKTGDIVKYENNAYRILGRRDVDIIRTGGFTVSALEIENQLLSHSDIKECVVIGLPDTTWGHKIAAVVVTKENSNLSLHKLREWSRDKFLPHSVPTEMKIVESLPKNTMGKVNKKELLKNLFPNVTNVY